jgi:hypothetical protein
MNKLFAIWDLLNEGRMVANPVFWKKMQSTGQPVLASLLIGLVALLKGTPYEIQVPDATLTLIAGGIFAAVNWLLTRITTTKDIRILPIVDRDEPLPNSVPSTTSNGVQVVDQPTASRQSINAVNNSGIYNGPS